MFLTKRKNGIYYVGYVSEDGKRSMISTGTKLKSQATKFMMDFQNKRSTPTDLQPFMLKQFIHEFMKYSETAHTIMTYRDYKNTFRFVERYFGNIDVKQLNQAKIQAYVDHRIRNSSFLQARKDLITLKSAFNKLISFGLLETNPCDKIKRLKLPEKLPMYYKREEIDKLLANIDSPDFKDLVVVALNTGLRQGELITLKWEDVSFETKSIILTNRDHITKSKRIRSVPINNTVHEILQRRSFYQHQLYSPIRIDHSPRIL